MSNHVTPRYEVIIDEAACKDAINCLKCVKVCLNHGPNVLAFVNKEAPYLDEYQPKKYQDIPHRILSAFMVNCDGCAKCVEVCPENAISIKTPKSQIPRAVVTRESSIVMCCKLKDGTKVYPDSKI